MGLGKLKKIPHLSKNLANHRLSLAPIAGDKPLQVALTKGRRMDGPFRTASLEELSYVMEECLEEKRRIKTPVLASPSYRHKPRARRPKVTVAFDPNGSRKRNPLLEAPRPSKVPPLAAPALKRRLEVPEPPSKRRRSNDSYAPVTSRRESGRATAATIPENSDYDDEPSSTSTSSTPSRKQLWAPERTREPVTVPATGMYAGLFGTFPYTFLEEKRGRVKGFPESLVAKEKEWMARETSAALAKEDPTMDAEVSKAFGFGLETEVGRNQHWVEDNRMLVKIEEDGENDDDEDDEDDDDYDDDEDNNNNNNDDEDMEKPLINIDHWLAFEC
jgi:hypothetical protein